MYVEHELRHLCSNKSKRHILQISWKLGTFILIIRTTSEKYGAYVLKNGEIENQFPLYHWGKIILNYIETISGHTIYHLDIIKFVI